jgi:hypothetical protein
VTAGAAKYTAVLGGGVTVAISLRTTRSSGKLASVFLKRVRSVQVPRYITSKWVYWVFGMVFYGMMLSILNRHVTRAAHHQRSRPGMCVRACARVRVFVCKCLRASCVYYTTHPSPQLLNPYALVPKYTLVPNS